MKAVFKAVLCVILIVAFSGCTKTVPDSSKLNIVTSFYPMYIMTANIVDGVEDVELTNLTSSQTGCLHDYQITTKDMIKLSHANVLVANGGGMENFIDKAVSLYGDLKIINASEDIAHIHEEHEHEEEHEDEHEHGENAHYWVSISMYMEQVEKVSKELCKIDPKNAEIYEKNSKAYIEKLEALKEKMHNTLDNIASKNIVTFHEAFEFFAEEFDLNIVAVIEREPVTYPSSRDVAQIIDMIKNKDVKAIFVEPQYSRTAADTIARETNVNVYSLDPIVTGELDKDAYISIMEKNLETLLEALS